MVISMHIRRPEDLAAAVRDARHKQSMTQVELASRLEVNREWVSRLESGEPGVSLGLVLRALTILGLAVRIDMPNEIAGPAAKPPPSTRTRPRVSIDEIVDD